MKQFFTDLIIKLPILIGVDMGQIFEVDELKEMVDILVKLSNTSPYDQISDEVKQRIVMDQISKDESIINVPYGRKPGINKYVVDKWYKKHWDLHGQKIASKNEQQKEKDEEESVVPPEVADHYLKIWKNQLIGDHFKPEFKGIGDEMKKIQREDEERLNGRKSIEGTYTKEDPAIRERRMKAARDRGLHKLDFKDLNTFDVEGQKIVAQTREQAEEIYLECYV